MKRTEINTIPHGRNNKRRRSYIEDAKITRCVKCNYYKTHDVFALWGEYCDDCIKKEKEMDVIRHDLNLLINPSIVVKTPNTYITTAKVNKAVNFCAPVVQNNIATTKENDIMKNLSIVEQQLRESERQNEILKYELHNLNFNIGILRTEITFLESTNDIMRRVVAKNQSDIIDQDNNIINQDIDIDTWFV